MLAGFFYLYYTGNTKLTQAPPSFLKTTCASI